MDKNDRRALKDLAGQRLAEATYSPRKLMLIHAGALLILSLTLALLDYLLEQQIGSTGGLGGIGSRSVLATIQAVLRLAQAALLPFWQMGYLFVAMKLARHEDISPWDLTEGFRRLGPVFRLNLLKTVITVFAAIASGYISSMVFAMTPFALPLLKVLESAADESGIISDPAALQEALSAATDEVFIPLMVIFLLVFLVISVPLFYRYRLASYFLLDSDEPRAIAAMRSSRKLMRYLCIDMFKLDASFWWFYALEALITAIGYGDLILSQLGFTIPIHADLASFLFYFVYLVALLALNLWRKNHLEVTYACTYDHLRSRHDPRPQPKPQNQPWKY